MKSLTKKISLLLILSATLFLSSCLDSRGRHYTGNLELSYVTEGDFGVIYARTLAGYFITSPKISQLTPGRITRISYQVKPDEDKQTVVDMDPVGNTIMAFEAEVNPEVEHLEHTTLNLSTAPTDNTGERFESFMDPIFASNIYFGDRWIFPYTYKAKKGESAKVSFYLASDEDAKNAYSDVLIDVRLEKLGSAENDAIEKIEGDNIVADFSEIRLMFADKANQEGNINIKFRYYRSNMQEPSISNKPFSMHIGTN